MDRDEGDEMLPLLVLLGTIAGAWYLLIVRPQKDQQTRHGRLVERLQVGDHVLTVGGIYGRVVAIEGPSVVLELAPGLTSRIATDGIARIVHGGEAALPTTQTDGTGMVDAGPTPRQALDTDMHQHPHPDQQQAPQAFAAPQYAPPQQPYAAVQAPVAPAAPQHAIAPTHVQQHAPQPVHYAQQHEVQPAPAQYAMPPVQLPAPPAPMVTPRAHVGGSIPTFEPRPWTDVAPTNAPVPPVQPVQYSQPQYAQPQYAQPQQVAAPQPMAMHQPFAVQAQPQPVQQQYAPMQPQSMPVHQPVHAQQHARPVPVAPQMVAPQVHQHVYAQEPQVAAPVAAEQPARRHSRAPQGMGSSLRLDDPSLRDTMVRAREERAGLAGEYRKLTASMVAVEPTIEQTQPMPAAHPQLIGHDPNGMPLFAAPGAPGTHAMEQYPMPAHPQPAHAMPRPVVAAPHADVDPALSGSAFQRRTPYAPDPALQPAQAAAPAHAHVPAHA